MNWKAFFDWLGLDGTRWQWRIHRWEQRWRERWTARDTPPACDASRRNAGRERSSRSRYKFCEACGALLGWDEATCPRCQAPAPSGYAQALRRRLALAWPSWCPVSMILIAANLAVLLAAMRRFGARQLTNPEPEMLISMGALIPGLFWEGEYWRILTYGYVHIGLLHIAFNMFALSQVGLILEEQVGRCRFFAAYTLTLLGGGLLDVMLRGRSLVIIAGASGALFGLIGLGMSYAHFYGGYTGRSQRIFFAQWAVYGFLFGLVIGADNIAHVGGFITGAALGYLVEHERARRERFDRFWIALSGLCVLATGAAFVWMVGSAR